MRFHEKVASGERVKEGSGARINDGDESVDIRSLDDEQVLALCRSAKLDVYDKFIIQ